MERRTFLRGALVGSGLVLGGSLWREVAADSSRSSPRVTPYGLLLGPDANGIQLPPGFTSRVLARSGEEVPGTSYTWHRAPDGGACFADGAGWVYASNSEARENGGVGVLRFGRDGEVTDAYRILSDTSMNCSGGATPWNTWLSCEEISRGNVYETYPLGGKPAVRREAMGTFKHEAAAVDPVRRCIYLTEDQSDGCFYRFVPDVWPNLSRGRLEVLIGGRGLLDPVAWAEVPDPGASDERTRYQVPGARHFDGGEGCVFGGGKVWFTTKGDSKVWELDPGSGILAVIYDQSAGAGRDRFSGVDGLARSTAGDLLVAEDGDGMEIAVISALGGVTTFLRVRGHDESEITGPAFSPDGTRLYFSSQRGTKASGKYGVTYEVRGPFRV